MYLQYNFLYMFGILQWSAIQGISKKSFTTLKAYINLFRGHAQCFELCKKHRVLPGIVMVQCDFHWEICGCGNFQWSHHVSCQCRIWGSKNPLVYLEHVRDSPKVSVFCTLSKERVYCLFHGDDRYQYSVSRHAPTVPHSTDEDDQEGCIHFQQDGTPPLYLTPLDLFLCYSLKIECTTFACKCRWAPNSNYCRSCRSDARDTT
jgi:hypothetical protein